MRTFSIVLLLALSACSSGESTSSSATPPSSGDTPLWVSGKRLRAHIVDGGGGAASFVTWKDTKLGATCSFVQWETGGFRCLSGAGNASYYVDAACTQGAIVVPTGVASSAYAIAPVKTGSCDPADDTFTAYQLGADLGMTQLHTKASGSCTGATAPAGAHVFALGAKADVSAFVGAEIVVEPRGQGLAARVLVGGDGSRQILAAMDTTKNATCVGQLGLDPTPTDGRCLPPELGEVTYFADAMCSTKGLAQAAIPSGCSAPTVALEHTGTCGAIAKAYGIGPAETTSNFYVGAPDNCSPVDGTLTLYPATMAFEASVFPHLLGKAIGTGRLHAMHFVAADGGGEIGAEPLFDTMLSSPCAPAQFTDGMSRCVPKNAPSPKGVFADAACTMELIETPTNCAAPTEVVRYDASLMISEIDSVGAKYTGAFVYQMSTSCMSVLPDAADYYAIGAKVDSSVFATVTERDE